MLKSHLHLTHFWYKYNNLLLSNMLICLLFTAINYIKCLILQNYKAPKNIEHNYFADMVAAIFRSIIYNSGHKGQKCQYWFLAANKFLDQPELEKAAHDACGHFAENHTILRTFLAQDHALLSRFWSRNWG